VVNILLFDPWRIHAERRELCAGLWREEFFTRESGFVRYATAGGDEGRRILEEG
jgi:hypothetical protein